MNADSGNTPRHSRQDAGARLLISLGHFPFPLLTGICAGE
jgi:hypothetical protein